MKRKPYLEDFTLLEVSINGCEFYINGTVAFDTNLQEGYFDFDIPDIDIKEILVRSGHLQTDKDFIKFFWQAGSLQIEMAIGKFLETYHSSLLEDEANPDEIYDNQKQG
jgi:hypothetical protein